VKRRGLYRGVRGVYCKGDGGREWFRKWFWSEGELNWRRKSEGGIYNCRALYSYREEGGCIYKGGWEWFRRMIYWISLVEWF
jgi:hypothetical protein